MARGIVLEEFHLTVYAPRGLPDGEYDAMRQALDDPPLHARLRRAARHVLRRHPALKKVKARLSR